MTASTTSTRTALSNRQIVRAALVVLLGFLASGVLGLVRLAIVSITFGGGEQLDAFYAAQRIPETVYTLVAGGALGSSFIPVFARFIADGDEAGAWRLASAAVSLAWLAGSVLALVVMLFAGVLVPTVLVPNATPEQAALTASLTQLMMVTVSLFAISGLLMGILNARQQFALPALALSMNNVGQIVGALFLTRLFPPEQAVYGLAWGAVLGAALHLLIQLPGLPKVGAHLRFLPNLRTPGAREVLTLMLPRTLGLGIVQINFLVNVALTSAMLPGSLTALTTAWTLMFFVLGVIAQSVGTALFPSLSALAAANDMVGYKNRLANALRAVLFLAFPATFVILTLAADGVALVIQYRNWTAEQTAATAWALAFFAIAIAGHSLLEVLSRAFYALSDTWTPVLVGAASIVANIALSLILINVVGSRDALATGAFAGLALANSLATLVEAGVLWLLLRRRIGDLHDRYVLGGAARALVAAILMGAAIYGSQRLLDAQSILLQLLIGLAVGGVTYFGLSMLLGVEEAKTIPAIVVGRLRR